MAITDFEDDEEQETEEKEAPAKDEQPDVRAQVAAALAEIKAQESRAAADQSSSYDKIKAEMIKRNFDPNSVEAAALVAQAIVADQMKALEQKQAKDRVDQLVDSTYTAIGNELDDYVKELPQLRWAKKEAVAQVEELLLKGKDYAGAREKIQSGKLPDSKDIKKAVNKVVEVFCKENGISGKGSSSRAQDSKAKTSGTSGGTSTADDYSGVAQTMYLATLNATKDPEKATAAANRFVNFGF